MKPSNFEIDYIIYHLYSSLLLLHITLMPCAISPASESSRTFVQLSSSISVQEDCFYWVTF